MSKRCVDCGAEALIQEESLDLCPLCAEARDALHRLGDKEICANLNSARAEYCRALAEMQTAHDLLRELEPGHPDGSLRLKQVGARFRAARDAYEDAINALLKKARELRPKI